MNHNLPTRLGDFRLVREVGKGGMGIVYEAVQESLDRRVALKVLAHPSMRDEKSVRRFERESRAAASLHHTNIVPVFGVGQADGLHYYVMQFIDGFGLDEVLRELRLPGGRTGLQVRSATTPTGLETRPADHQRSSARSIASCLQADQFEDAHAIVAPPSSDGSHQPVSTDELADMPTVVTDRPGQPGHSRVSSTSTKPLDEEANSSDTFVSEVESEPTSQAEEFAGIPNAESGEGILANSTTANSCHQSSAKLNPRYWPSVAKIGVQVADALEYAHERGVLHRDIKPSNLLIDDSGTVRVTDFGLAKARGSDDLTLTGDIIGTVRYMAPERFSSEGDARSDIYSLGLTLYELLTLRPAFAEEDQHQLIRQVLDDEPAPPRRLRPDIPRDLETIVLKAAAREPDARYQTAREMSDDLRRFSLHKPIAARQANYAERARRWSRRNPIIAGLSAVLLAVAIVSFISVSWLWRDAEHQKQLSIAAEAKAREDRDTAVAALIEAQQQKAAAEAANREVQRAIEAAIGAEGEARKSESEVKQKLEHLQATLADFERARQLDEKRKADLPTRGDFLSVVASNHHNLAGLQYATGKTAEAIKSYKEAIIERTVLVVDYPQVDDYRDGLAASYHSLAKVHRETGNPAEAMDYYSKAVSVRQGLLEQDNMSAAYRSALAASLFQLAELQREQGQHKAAQGNMLKAFEHREKLVADNAQETRFRRQLAVTCTNLGELNELLNAVEAAIDFYRQSAGHWQLLVTAEPDNTSSGLRYADACWRLGKVVRGVQGAAPAIETYGTGVEILTGILARQPQHADAAELLTAIHEYRAAAYAELGDHRATAAELDRALLYVTEAKRNDVRIQRALALARSGDHQVATAEANTIAATKDSPAALIYLSAKVLAVASVTVGNDTSIDNDIQGGLSKLYADQAVEHLLACKKADYFTDKQNVENLESDAEFRHLLKRNEIKMLLGKREN